MKFLTFGTSFKHVEPPYKEGHDKEVGAHLIITPKTKVTIVGIVTEDVAALWSLNTSSLTKKLLTYKNR